MARKRLIGNAAIRSIYWMIGGMRLNGFRRIPFYEATVDKYQLSPTTADKYIAGLIVSRLAAF